MQIRKIYRKLYQMFWGRLNPSRYARKIGVNFPYGQLHIYGYVDWGTEPWIINVGKNVHITEQVRFITHDGGTLLFRDRIPDLEITKPITIGDNVYIGNNVILLPGVSIGNNVVIGAGSVVTKHIPDNTVVAGVPARKIKTTEEYFQKISNESLHVGNLRGQEKDIALKKIYGYKGSSKGIYF